MERNIYPGCACPSIYRQRAFIKMASVITMAAARREYDTNGFVWFLLRVAALLRMPGKAGNSLPALSDGYFGNSVYDAFYQ